MNVVWHQMARLTVVLVMLFGLALVGPMAASAQNGGNSAAAQACQQGGYAELVRTEDGSRFKNAGDCASYAAQGGTLDRDDDLDGVADGPDNCDGVANPTQADADGDFIGDACDTDVYLTAGLFAYDGGVGGTGFTPDSTVTYSVQAVDAAGNPVFGGFATGTATTDSSGAFFVQADYNYCYSGSVESIVVSASDATGVTVTETIPVSC